MRGKLLSVREYKSYLPATLALEEDLSPRSWSINMYGGHDFINNMKLTKHKVLGRCKLQSRGGTQEQSHSLSQSSSSNGWEPSLVIYCIHQSYP